MCEIERIVWIRENHEWNLQVLYCFYPHQRIYWPSLSKLLQELRGWGSPVGWQSGWLGPAFTSLVEIIYKVNSTEWLIKIESQKGTPSSWKLSYSRAMSREFNTLYVQQLVVKPTIWYLPYAFIVIVIVTSIESISSILDLADVVVKT